MRRPISDRGEQKPGDDGAQANTVGRPPRSGERTDSDRGPLLSSAPNGPPARVPNVLAEVDDPTVVAETAVQAAANPDSTSEVALPAEQPAGGRNRLRGELVDARYKVNMFLPHRRNDLPESADSDGGIVNPLRRGNRTADTRGASRVEPVAYEEAAHAKPAEAPTAATTGSQGGLAAGDTGTASAASRALLPASDEQLRRGDLFIPTDPSPVRNRNQMPRGKRISKDLIIPEQNPLRAGRATATGGDARATSPEAKSERHPEQANPAETPPVNSDSNPLRPDRS